MMIMEGFFITGRKPCLTGQMYASNYLKEMVKGGSEISNCRSCGGAFQFFSSQPGIPV